MTAPTVDAIIPIRFADCCEPDGSPRFRLQGRTLWDITLDQVLASDAVRRAIVAHDDDRFLAHLKGRDGRIVPHRRPDFLSEAGVTTLDVLGQTAEALTASGAAPDYCLLTEITHPLRPKSIVAELIAALGAGQADSLITCHRVHYNFWRRESAGGMVRVTGAGDSADIAMFQELIGIGSLFRTGALLGGNPFGGQVDIVPIDRFWATIDVRDEDGLWLAERYLERIGAQL